MTIQIAPDLLVGFLFALVRASAWIVVTPPFNASGIPARVRIAVAAAIAFLLAPTLGHRPDAFDLAPFLSGLVYQVAVGLALGFLVQLVFAAVQAAGELIDFFSGFSAASIFDPFTQANASPFGRLYQLLATAILFALNGHLLLLRGFIQSFEAAPLGGLNFNRLDSLLTSNVLTFFLAAVEIAAPLLAALFCAEIVLGLLTKAAPQMNVLQFGFALKILIVLLLAGVALPALPDAVGRLLERVVSGDIFVSP